METNDDPPFKAVRGVALLISLSVIMLLSTGLTKIFEKKSVEIAHLANSLSRFQAETLSRSVFRAIAVAIREKGLAFIIQNKAQWRELPIPVVDGHFIIEEVKSIDHLFYLNQDFQEGDPRTSMLLNLANLIKRKQKSMEPEMIESEIFPLISAINDWIDQDGDPDEAYFNDRESYQDEKPEFEVKNRKFERLSEARLIPEFRELRLSPRNAEEHFRVLGKLTAVNTGQTESIEHIDVNAVVKEEMEEFLERFQGVFPYEKAYDNRSEITRIIFGEEEDDYKDDYGEEAGLQFGAPGFVDAKARFSKKEELQEQIKNALGLSGKELKILDLFSIRTECLAINYRVTVNKATLRIKSVVGLSYLQNSLNINKFKILKFKIIR